MPSVALSRAAAAAFRSCCIVWLLAAAACARDTASERAAWPDGFLARVEALALLQTLNADLLSHDSATLTLERWCAAHRLASPPRIVAERLAGADKPPTEDQRRELGVTATDTVRYRRVRLLCGTVVLSEADNWYVPARLSPDMNRLLDTTDTPFGRAVQALHFQRHTISAKLLWQPLPKGWEMSPVAASVGAGKLVPPRGVLEHRAMLALPNGTPVSELVETYTGSVLAFALPQP